MIESILKSLMVGLALAFMAFPADIYAEETDLVPYPAHLESRVVCPLCRGGNMKSNVFVRKCWLVKAREVEFFDEDGNIHYAVRDTTVCQYECSWGHKFRHRVQW